MLGPLLADLGFQVLLPLGYDTDARGTFSGDVRRPGTAFEPALEKARRACRATGVPRAVSSEGSYRPCQTLFPGARNAELPAFAEVAQVGERLARRLARQGYGPRLRQAA